MEKDKNLKVDRNILFFAFRYALGRMSYAPYTVTSAIKDNIDNISTEDIRQYIKEINEYEGFGMDFDKEHWLSFANFLENELKIRGRE